MGHAASPILSPQNSGSRFIRDQEKPLDVMHLATSTLDELIRMCLANEPLWIRGSDGIEVLNVQEYAKTFPNPQRPNQRLMRIEASRGTAFVMAKSTTLVDTFLNSDKWIEMFPCMISKAKTLQIIAGSPGHYNGSLRLMHAEFQMLSPLVPTKEVHFLRYCRQLVNGMWAIVDFPLDSLQDLNLGTLASPFPVYKRKPSGCLIQDMLNGYSNVTWVEHVEVEDKLVHHIFNQVVSYGMAFGAAKWLAVLRRQCERVASLMTQNISSDLGDEAARTNLNLMKSARRMVRTFCLSLSSGGQTWKALLNHHEDTVRISLRKETDPGHPIGLFLSAASTTWLPYARLQVYNLLRDEHRRAQMGILSDGINSFHDVARIAYGSYPGNWISLLGIDGGGISTEQFMLQESYTDESESVVAYTTLDLASLEIAMFGTADPSMIPILPLGFVIVPVKQDGGCLLTVGLRVLVSTDPDAKLIYSSHVNAITNQLHQTVYQINTALRGTNTSRSIEENHHPGQGRIRSDRTSTTPPGKAS